MKALCRIQYATSSTSLSSIIPQPVIKLKGITLFAYPFAARTLLLRGNILLPSLLWHLNMYLLFSINNKLQNPEAAHGVLIYAMKNNAQIDFVSSTLFLICVDNRYFYSCCWFLRVSIWAYISLAWMNVKVVLFDFSWFSYVSFKLNISHP